jgi:hypothetical protein
VRVVLIERLQLCPDGAPKLFRGRQIAGRDVGHPFVEAGDGLLDDQVQQVFLALEVMVEAALEDPDRVGDILDRGGVIALGLKHLRRRRDDFFEIGHAPGIVSASAPATD